LIELILLGFVPLYFFKKIIKKLLSAKV